MSRLLSNGQLILQDVLFRSGELTALSGTTSDYLGQAKEFVQRCYSDLISLEPWPWSLSDPPGVLQLVPRISTTCILATASASVVLAASYAYSLVGYWLQVVTETVPYRIITHSFPSATVTLDLAYQPQTGLSGGGPAIPCYLFKDEYALSSNCLKVWKVWNRTNPWARVDLITEGKMSTLFPSRISGTNPIKASVMRNDKLRVYPYCASNYVNLEYEYTKKLTADLTFDGVAGTDTPIVPVEDTPVISDMATALLLTLKKDSGAVAISNLSAIKIEEMRNVYLKTGLGRAKTSNPVTTVTGGQG